VLSIRSTLFLLVLSFYSSKAMADIQLSTGDGVDILAINRTEISNALSTARQSKLHLQNGLQQLIVRYSVEIKTGFSEYELESSRTFVLLFEAADKHVLLTAPEINSTSELAEFNRTAGFTLRDSLGQKQPYRWSPLDVEGFQLNIDYVKELERFNRSNTEASLASTTGSVMPELEKIRHVKMQQNRLNVTDIIPSAAPLNIADAKNASAKKASNVDSELAIEMLKYWYQQATAQQKSDFRKWMMRQ